ncbi:MAG: HAD-IIB family hydrolase [Clostridia bacterium]|nr:HAD-IIB family hydrolase [Clostridia bacterium]
MKKFENIMIATDLDGTFLANGTVEVEKNIEKVRYFTDNGGIFTFATGRASWNLDAILPNAWKYLNFPAITCNGMCLYNLAEKKPEYEIFMPSEEIVGIVRHILPRYPDACFRAAGREGIVIFQPEHPFMVEEMKHNPVKYFIYPYEEWVNHKFYKLTITGREETVDAVRTEIDEVFPNRYDMNKSCSTLLEILPRGRSKADMLISVKRGLEADGKKIKLYAVGDYENDIPMLRIADVAVCPANAIGCVKNICSLCLCDNNSGVIADLIDFIDEEL